ncbi:MAG TPA: methyl-accepting chemotaxis protein [Leptospiraceae bacterium]|nr:methyl-accepting chemotaxis protein [Leptospiraceae bacterium]HNM06125.1 methyl-accepting chemotaxis protein [Leptospiraceae bacterium]HNN05837.1 methyl-accepting chemotaxis protein [Leptospiraceae bacterium]
MKMTDLSRKYFNLIMLRAEIFVYVVPVPMIVYFGFLCIDSTAEKMKALAFSAVVGSIVGFSLGYAIRRMLFMPLLDEIFSDEKKIQDRISVKTALLRYPFTEVLCVIARWLVGGGLAWALFISTAELKFHEIIVIPTAIGLAVPISSVSFYFISEGVCAEIISVSDLKAYESEEMFQGGLDFEKRMSLLLFSIMLLSAGIFGFLLYFTSSGDLHLNKILFHISVLFMIFIIILYYSVYTIAQTVRRGIEETSSVLSMIASGKIPPSVSVSSRDEFGRMSSNINSLASQLRNVVSAVRSTAEETVVFSEKLTSSSASLYEIISAQTSSVNEIADVMKALDLFIHETAENAGNATELTLETGQIQKNLYKETIAASEVSDRASLMSDKALELADLGRNAVRETAERMDEIHSATAAITGIVEAIGEIADQVNLLSLNASIESARAGEYGKGFAVVAGEVSKLAEKTLQNSKEISKFSSLASKRVRDGRNSTAVTADVFESIRQKAAETKGSVDEIAEGIKKQMSLAEEFGSAFQVSLAMTKEISDSTRVQSEKNSSLMLNLNRIREGSEGLLNSSAGLKKISDSLVDKVTELKKHVSFFSLS